MMARGGDRLLIRRLGRAAVDQTDVAPNLFIFEAVQRMARADARLAAGAGIEIDREGILLADLRLFERNEIAVVARLCRDLGRGRFMMACKSFNRGQLALLCERAKHRPMVVQNRCYAAFGWDRAVRDLCRTHHIVYQGFSLLTANREVFLDPGMRALAEKYATGVAQLVFRFAMQIGMLSLTGTTKVEHMAEDLRADRFTLTPDELQRIETIGL